MPAPDSFVVVAIAASAGGISAIKEVLAALPPATSAAFLVVQHLAPAHVSLLAQILGRATPMQTREAHEGDVVREGVVLVAPPDQHMSVRPDGTVALTHTTRIHYVRPSADVLFESVGLAFGRRAIAIILSGTGEDGAHGAEIIKRHGGRVIAQREAAGLFYGGMPDAAIRAGVVDAVLSTDEIGGAIGAFVAQHIGL